MRKVFALSLPLMTALFVATARPAVAETEITTCGQVLPGGAVFLSGDLAAGDVIDVRIRTGTGWSATTADLGVAVEIEC